MIDPHLSGLITRDATRQDPLIKPVQVDVRLFDTSLDVRLYVEGHEIGNLVVEVNNQSILDGPQTKLVVWTWSKEGIIDAPDSCVELFDLNDDPRHSSEIEEENA
jgi:hypothetical protein